jgi:ribonuclease P protein component
MGGKIGKPQGFPKSERVRRTEDFTRILRRGRRSRGQFFDAYWIADGRAPGPPDPESAGNRAGIAAGKKLGPAVLRNRLKRRLREAYRRNKRELPCRGIAIVFVASRRTIGRSAAEVEADMRRVLRAIAADSSGGPSRRSAS